jgi:hypothetical protein
MKQKTRKVRFRTFRPVGISDPAADMRTVEKLMKGASDKGYPVANFNIRTKGGEMFLTVAN